MLLAFQIALLAIGTWFFLVRLARMAFAFGRGTSQNGARGFWQIVGFAEVYCGLVYGLHALTVRGPTLKNLTAGLLMAPHPRPLFTADAITNMEGEALLGLGAGALETLVVCAPAWGIGRLYQRNDLAAVRFRKRLGIGALVLVLFIAIGWCIGFFIEQRRLNREELARVQQELQQARQTIDVIRYSMILSPRCKKGSSSQERYQLALGEVMCARKMDKAQLTALLDRFAAHVANDLNATPADTVRIAFKDQHYAEAASLSMKAGDEDLAGMTTAKAVAEQEQRRVSAIENYLLCGQAEEQLGHYQDALNAIGKAVNGTNKERNPVEWAEANTWLASLLESHGDYSRAVALLEQVLPIEENHLGPEAPKLAILLNNLAVLYQATHRPTDAEPLFKRALSIDEKSYGPDHPDLLGDLASLASLYRNMNRFAEEVPIMQRVLTIEERSHGPNPPDVAGDLTSLAATYCLMNRQADAEPLFKRALAIDEASYGPDHPEIAKVLTGLGIAYQAMHRLSDAEPLFKRALAIDEASYGADHPEVAVDLTNFAGLYQETNRLVGTAMLERALKILVKFQRRTGHEHPMFHACKANYASSLEAIGFSKSDIEKRIPEPPDRADPF